jgi:hypothetical protein
MPGWLSGDSTAFVTQDTTSGVRVPHRAPFNAAIAQLVERSFGRGKVVGSIPACSTILDVIMIALLDKNGFDIRKAAHNLPIEEITLEDIARSNEAARLSGLVIVYDRKVDKAKILKNRYVEGTFVIKFDDVPKYLGMWMNI